MRNDRAAGVVLKDGKVLTFWRYRNGREYYTLPGGTLENNEEPESGLIRELYEETNLKVLKAEKLFEYENTFQSPRTDHYFLVTEFSGEIKLGAPELFHQSRENIFRPEWIEVEKLKEIALQPEAIIPQLTEKLMNR